MELSTRGRYAVMAMVALAANGSGRPMPIAEIAAGQSLSACYLEQLLARLRRAGLVAAARGPGGGYTLARPAEQVSIAEIMLAAEERLDITRCTPEGPSCLGEPGARCPTHALWDRLGCHIRAFLEAVTLAEVARETRDATA